MSTFRLTRLTLTFALAAAMFAGAGCAPKSQSTLPKLPPLDGETAATAASKDPWAGRSDLLTPPPPTPTGPVALPPLKIVRLANGMRLLLLQDKRAPLVSMQLVIRRGWSSDPADKPGLAAFAAEMLVRGAKGLSAAAFAEAVEATGGSLTADATYEATVLSCDVVVTARGRCLTLLAAALTSPTFAKSEMSTVASRLVAEVRSVQDEGGALAAQHAQNLLWGNRHARGRAMSAESLRSITQADLVAWHQGALRPEFATLVVVGDFEARALQREAILAFAAWRARGQALPAPTAATPAISAPTLRLVDKPGQAQAQVVVAFPGIAHGDPAFFDTVVWNHIFGGGGFASRLARALRGEPGRGGASATFDRNNDAGAWVASASGPTSQAVQTLETVLREISKLRGSGVTAREVEDAIVHLTGSYGLRFETLKSLATALTGADLHDYGEEYLENFPVAVARVTPKSASEAATRLLTQPAMAVTIVGDAATIAPLLEAKKYKFQTVQASDPITPVASSRPSDPAADRAAKQVLDQALAAKGGPGALRKLASVKLVGKGTVVQGGKTIDIEMTRLYAPPNRSRVSLQLSGGAVGTVTIEYAMTAAGAWQKTPAGVIDIPPNELATVERERWLDPDFILLRHTERGTVVRGLGDEKVDGTTYHKVNITSADKRFTATLFIEPATKRIGYIAFPDGAQVGTVRLDDYRQVGGLWVPFSRTTMGGDEKVELRLERFEVNVAVPADAFAKPTAGAK